MCYKFYNYFVLTIPVYSQKNTIMVAPSTLKQFLNSVGNYLINMKDSMMNKKYKSQIHGK